MVEAGRPAVDISFFDENPFELDAIAKEKGVTVVMDCGVAPGMSNIIAGYHHERMKVDYFECLVGGLPVKRSWPHQYKAPFSPIDVVEEYTRPARIVENGEVVVRPALSESEFVEIDPIGTLEASNTDGLRTLLETMPVPNMKEKTLRYPGHGRLMEALREGGFLSTDPVEVEGHAVRPLDVTSALLFPQWALREGEAEFTYMRVTIEGTTGGRAQTVVWELLDRGDAETGETSMARTTGYACTACVHLVASGRFRRPGVTPPELVAAEAGVFEALLAYQEERGVVYRRSVAEA